MNDEMKFVPTACNYFSISNNGIKCSSIIGRQKIFEDNLIEVKAYAVSEVNGSVLITNG